MILAREEAIKEFREQWEWYAENPMKQKSEYPKFQKQRPLKQCYLCEYTDFVCSKCPVEWPKTHAVPTVVFGIPCVASYYGDWDNATKPEERSRLAALIRDLPEKKEKPEPALKVGDWIKVLGTGGCHASYDTFFQTNGIDQFLSKFKKGKRPTVGVIHQIVAIGGYYGIKDSYFGPLYVIESPDEQVYIMNNKHKELELTEPPKPAPKFKVGDKVVPVSKTVPGFVNDINNDSHWRMSKNIRYFFVVGINKSATFIYGKTVYICNQFKDVDWGNLFYESDLIHYVEPVTWQEAMQAWMDGKTIVCENCAGCKDGPRCGSKKREEFLEENSNAFLCRNQLKTGTWQIKE